MKSDVWITSDLMVLSEKRLSTVFAIIVFRLLENHILVFYRPLSISKEDTIGYHFTRIDTEFTQYIIILFSLHFEKIHLINSL